MEWFSRKSLAKVLGVTPGRVSQLQAEGALARPAPVEGLDVEAWPGSYTTSIAAERRGRCVSKSVFGLPPASVPVEMDPPAIVELGGGIRAMGLRFGREEFPIVLVQEVARTAPHPYPGLGPAPASPLGLSQGRRDVTAIHRLAEEWFEGDPSRAAWVVADYGAFEPPFAEYVVELDEASGPALWGRRARFDDGVPEYGVHVSEVRASALAERLGRRIPVFAPQLCTAEAIEGWVRGGMRPRTEVVCDWTGEESAVNGAYLLHAWTAPTWGAPLSFMRGSELREESELVSSSDLEVLSAALQRRLDWSISGQVSQMFVDYGPHSRHGGHCDGGHEEVQLLPLAPRFGEQYRDKLPSELPRPVSDPVLVQGIADRVGNTIAYWCGPFGASPSPELVHALKDGLHATIRQLPIEDPRAGCVQLRDPYAIRSWTASERPGALAEYAAGLRKWVKVRVSEDPLTPAFNALEAHLVEKEGCRSEFRIFLDAQENPVMQGVSERFGEKRAVFAAAVPVLRPQPGGSVREELVDYRELAVSPVEQSAPVIMIGADGEPRLMPFGGCGHSSCFAFGYRGGGPHDLCSAISAFHSAIGLDEAAVRERLSPIVVTAPQESELRISAASILPEE